MSEKLQFQSENTPMFTFGLLSYSFQTHTVIPQIKPELLKPILLNGCTKYHWDEAEVMVKTRT